MDGDSEIANALSAAKGLPPKLVATVFNFSLLKGECIEVPALGQDSYYVGAALRHHKCNNRATISYCTNTLLAWTN